MGVNQSCMKYLEEHVLDKSCIKAVVIGKSGGERERESREDEKGEE